MSSPNSFILTVSLSMALRCGIFPVVSCELLRLRSNNFLEGFGFCHVTATLVLCIVQLCCKVFSILLLIVPPPYSEQPCLVHLFLFHKCFQILLYSLILLQVLMFCMVIDTQRLIPPVTSPLPGSFAPFVCLLHSLPSNLLYPLPVTSEVYAHISLLHLVWCVYHDNNNNNRCHLVVIKTVSRDADLAVLITTQKNRVQVLVLASPT